MTDDKLNTNPNIPGTLRPGNNTNTPGTTLPGNNTNTPGTALPGNNPNSPCTAVFGGKAPEESVSPSAVSDSPLISAIIEAIQDRKGKDITVIDLSGLEVSNALQYVICQGNTPTQVSAIADSIRESVQERLGIKPYNYDGYRNSTWIVIDYGSVMVHVFVPDARKFYDIEQLWCDGVITEVANLD